MVPNELDSICDEGMKEYTSSANVTHLFGPAYVTDNISLDFPWIAFVHAAVQPPLISQTKQHYRYKCFQEMFNVSSINDNITKKRLRIDFVVENIQGCEAVSSQLYVLSDF